MAYLGSVNSGNSLESRAKEVYNLMIQLEQKWADLYEAVEQSYADASIGNSIDATYEAFYGRPAGWAARIRSFAAHTLQYTNFLDNGVVTQADRRFDANWFSS